MMRALYFLILSPLWLLGQNNTDIKVNDNNHFNYKQDTIPLNASNGIPISPAFPKHPKSVIKSTCPIEGFEVDKNGKYYFFSGVSNTLSVFNKGKKEWSKEYKKFHSTKIYLYQNHIYLFKRRREKGAGTSSNSLYVLNKSTGEIKNVYKNLITNNTSPPYYLDSLFVLEVHEKKNRYNIPERGFLLYNLKGDYIKEVDNHLYVTTLTYNSIYNMNFKGALGYSFLGFWKGNRIYFHEIYDDENWKNSITHFTLTDNEGRIVKSYQIKSIILGEDFYTGFEYEKIRNNSIFILRRDEKVENAIITELPLDKIFK